MFTIELLPNNRTLYKPCGKYNNSYQARTTRVGRNFLPTLLVTDDDNKDAGKNNENQAVEEIDVVNKMEKNKEDITVDVHCDNDDTSGHYVFVRDDRKKNEFFTLCEVEIFSDEEECKILI